MRSEFNVNSDRFFFYNKNKCGTKFMTITVAIESNKRDEPKINPRFVPLSNFTNKFAIAVKA